jgi:ABC-type dipeptide/oligopeptide/nickel transport system permease component
MAAWRRGTAVDKAGLWTGLGFYSMPPQWLGLMIVLFAASPAQRACRRGPRYGGTASETPCCPS